MPRKTDNQKRLENLFKRVNFALPKSEWVTELKQIKELADKVLREE